MEEILNLPQEDVEVVDIQFRPGQKIYFFDPNGIDCKAGDHVIIDTARGAEFGICSGGNHTIPYKDVVAPLRKVLRRATAQDERIVAENRAKEKKAFDVCLQKIGDILSDAQESDRALRQHGSLLLYFGAQGTVAHQDQLCVGFSF